MASRTNIEIFVSHLVKNSDEVIHRQTQLNTEQPKQNNYAFSLDKISLLHHSTCTPSNRYHIRTYNLQELLLSQTYKTDKHQLLSIIVDNTYFTYNGNTYKLTSGLPMGSSISGIQAISYMDQLERRALSICPSCIFFMRYIDDILMLTSSSGEATAEVPKHRSTCSV